MRTPSDAVRRHLLRFAADTLTTLPADRVPVALRGVARFRPNRRAALGAAALATALDSDTAFRATVGDYVRTLGVALDDEDRDVAERAAAAELWQHPEAAELRRRADESGEPDALRAEIERLRGEIERLRGALDRASRATPVPESTTQPEVPEDGTAAAQLDRLRRRLRDQGVALREARDAVSAAISGNATEIEALRSAQKRSSAEVTALSERLIKEQARADTAVRRLEELRASERTGRDIADRRLELLLATVEGATAGLRREWKLTSGGPDPAQAVADRLADPTPTSTSATLAGWLGMPHAHLVIDGYNVTKSVWADLTLAEQRDRLVRELGLLAARTGAEITVVFDGSAVVAPQIRQRGVRVLFSPAGQIADEVIKRLVAAEPRGRVVLVVSADQEIVDDVVAHGARPVKPAELLVTLRGDELRRG